MNSIDARRWLETLDRFLPWLTAGILIFYSFINLFAIPYIGIVTNGSVISEVPRESLRALGVSQNDEIVSINGIRGEAFRADTRLKVFPLFEATPDVLALTLRDVETGEEFSVQLDVYEFERDEFVGRIVSQWSYGWLLWAVGTITYVFMRPKDHRWRLLMFFLFNLSILLSMGLPAGMHAAGAYGWLKFASWMFLPIAVHLHLLYPERLLPQRDWIAKATIGIYALFFMAGLWQALSPLQNSLYVYPFALGLLLILLLLILQVVLKKEVRRRLGMFFVIEFVALLALVLTPAIGAATGNALSSLAATLVVTPLIPFAYLYAAYRRQLWDLRARSNPVIVIYLFIFLVVIVMVVLFSAASTQFELSTADGFSLLVALLLGVLLSLTIYAPFSRFVQNRIFGIEMASEELMLAFSQRISTRLSLSALSAMIADEVLPNLLISQSVLLSWPLDAQPEAIMAKGIVVDDLDSLVNSRLATLSKTTTWFFSEDIPLGWVRLAIPLSVSGERTGLWLLGEHDPDDYYLHDEIAVLENFSHQIAIALENIYQSRRFMALYQTNISRHERQRTLLGQDLHDEVINQLSMLVHKATNPEVVLGINRVIEELRTTVGGLRPAMLNYGLYPALSQLVEDLRDRVGVNQRIVFEVHSRMERYHPIAEHQIYEIIHQACENSLRHANAKNLIIEGNLGVNDMQITVRDDGDGFEMHAQPDLLELLQQSQFGLAGMYERAELISARLSLFTAPGKGTSVSVSWLPADLNEEDIQFLMS